MTRAHLRVYGRVQGVFFREFARAEALRLGLAGWVRNRSDGTVEAVIEGEPDAVASFVEACRRGPPTSSVSEVEVIDDGEAILPPGFHVRPSL